MKRTEEEAYTNADVVKSLVAKRTRTPSYILQCPRVKSDITPCIIKDGRLAVVFIQDVALCVGCEIKVEQLLDEEHAHGDSSLNRRISDRKE